ncbi:sigma-54 dependent transcriptional regulator [Vibrio sp. JC009]|uniref:sigma-54-dependent transcriptional regulator n=1 Tax=Vibrio sp. JC009 TaxID=2912314 RepID=UPI0023AE8DBF|nr:sigma-54 dependent transcriptional regulator [Vibrio sp. JC009]WED22379.1 sigma-54 dependent transcriptional regulator [Vibrio sp. JC009]
MGTKFRLESVPGSLVVVGGKHEPWLSVLEQGGWQCQRCGDLRKADALLNEIGPCIGIVDLSQDEFSLNGVANLVSRYKHVRWLAFIRESQLTSDTISQFIVNFCIDFFTAPIPDTQLLSTIGHQLGMLTLERKVWPDYGNRKDMGLPGESVAMKRLREQVKRIASTDVSILVYGENGTGKEDVAEAIHQLSSRSKEQFVSINCGALSEARMAVEIFGIGAGEDDPDPALLKAHKGTLYLNDILTMPRSQQNNLLRFMQEGKLETKRGSVDLDVRILAAYSSDIDKAMADNDFSDELYHYINVLRINVPSLKERAGDVALLAKRYLQEYSKEYNAQAKDFSEEALKGLTHYHWPGNVRELMNLVKRAVLMSDTALIDISQLDLPQKANGKRSLKSIRENSERDALMLVLESHDGQVSPAAKELGVSRATMYRLLNKHNLITEAV